jgi:hypothetical protein
MLCGEERKEGRWRSYGLSIGAGTELDDFPFFQALGLPGLFDERHVCLEVAAQVGRLVLIIWRRE